MKDESVMEETIRIDGALEKTERRGEALAAISRIAIAGTILIAAKPAYSAGAIGHPLIIVSVVYALISFAGLAFVLAKIFHPSIPYWFVLLDSAAIAGALTMQARMHGMDVTHEFSLPLFSLAFVVLIHAAMRYRPGLVLFGAGSFMAFLFIFPVLSNRHLMMHPVPTSGSEFSHAWTESMALHDIGYLPLVFFALGVFLLFTSFDEHALSHSWRYSMENGFRNLRVFFLQTSRANWFPDIMAVTLGGDARTLPYCSSTSGGFPNFPRACLRQRLPRCSRLFATSFAGSYFGTWGQSTSS
jgi:hypothetical protein